ncbi:YcjF family protein [Merismopedia glauca]|uniref:EcsC family protein n=1 Tax=Merismopedia glauca CCAP 1448/3 TaxID=1296344 RepID=A0A2T1C922_9CYAN|nr:EcsC family protein [Merismopedia glauca]PSB04647.1 hypothetical protein C7B64_02900 [Merismopedia glauca CCAP 1448/3]
MTSSPSGNAIANTISSLSKVTSQQTLKWIEESTQNAGKAMSYVSNLPFLRPFVGLLRMDWFLGLIGDVDVAKAQAEVKKLQTAYPKETISQIAHRIIVQKSLQAGGVGLATSLLPGFALPFLAVDLAATAAIQTEMVYQIAAAYGMDLRDPARKGEIMGVFGLALGGRNALKAGLGFLRNIPVAGAAIGAGTDATMLYSLGYAACRFYEAKQKAASLQPTDATLQQIHQDTEQFIDRAIGQQDIINKVLVHMILASYPEKKWDNILPELQALQLDADSLISIARELKSPQPLESLIEQLDCDFSVSLLAQCRYLAQRDGVISPEEQKIVSALENKCQGKIEGLV